MANYADATRTPRTLTEREQRALLKVAESDIGVLLGHGAKSVARGHYLGEQMERNAALVAKLPMPEGVQMRGRRILVGGGGEVVSIGQDGARRPRNRVRGSK